MAKSKLPFIAVNNSTDYLNAINNVRKAVAKGDITLEEAAQETKSLGKIITVVRTGVATSIAAGQKPDTSFFNNPKPKSKRR